MFFGRNEAGVEDALEEEYRKKLLLLARKKHQAEHKGAELTIQSASDEMHEDEKIIPKEVVDVDYSRDKGETVFVGCKCGWRESEEELVGKDKNYISSSSSGSSSGSSKKNSKYGVSSSSESSGSYSSGSSKAGGVKY
tara:strand:+ start:328 stop:741 length:414 start_codon:yes stop_codon:yes gene_type:complete